MIGVPGFDNRHVEILITSYDVSDVVITSPNLTRHPDEEPIINVSLKLDSQSIHTFKLKNYTADVRLPDEVCLLITSSDISPISVVVKYIGDLSLETFLAFPVSSLGSEYYAVAWCEENATCKIGMVATEDNTWVEITETTPGMFALDSNTFKLQKYDVVVLESKIDPTGTRITGNASIVVYGGATTSNVGYDNTTSNHLIEQLPPVNAWGKMYVVFSSPFNRDGSVIRILKQNDVPTHLEISGRPRVEMQDTWYQTRVLYKESLFISATKSILVCGFSFGGRVDDEIVSYPSMMVYQPVEQFITNAKLHAFTGADYKSVYITAVHHSDNNNTGCVPDPRAIYSAYVVDSKWRITTIEIESGLSMCTFPPSIGVYIHGRGIIGDVSHTAMTDLNMISTVSTINYHTNLVNHRLAM